MEALDVLVVGGGPVGLVAAGQLGRLGVRTLLVEARRDVVPHPRARSVNVRTNEIFRAWGIEAEVRSVCLPVEWGEQMVFTRTLAGEEIGRVPMRTQGTRDGVEYSPCAWLLSSQDRLEPILRAHAARQPSVEQWWGWEVVGLDQGGGAGEWVTARVRDVERGEEREVRARFVIGADGASSFVRKAVGARLVGRHGLGSLVNTQFYANLGPWTDHRPAALYWTTAPATNVFQKIDEHGRWLCQIAPGAAGRDPQDLDPEEAVSWIRASVGVEDLDVEVVNTIPWSVSCTVADRFRVGRVFLAGDAAHQLPPSGGFGMNTGVQDVHALAWMLAGVVQGWASEALLDRYEAERAPIAEWNGQRSLENGKAVAHIRRVAEGRRPDLSGDGGLPMVRRYTNFLGMDLGLAYASGAFVPDGSEAPEVEDAVIDYVPVARPGHRAPHHWFRRAGQVTSSLDLFDARFVLLAGPGGAAWREAAASVAAPLAVHVVGEDLEDVGGGADVEGGADVGGGGGASTPPGTWPEAYGVAPDGAVLVRPDGMVAARFRHGGGGPPARLAGALAAILGSTAPAAGAGRAG